MKTYYYIIQKIINCKHIFYPNSEKDDMYCSDFWKNICEFNLNNSNNSFEKEIQLVYYLYITQLYNKSKANIKKLILKTKFKQLLLVQRHLEVYKNNLFCKRLNL
jgi:hypothetical protein